MKTRFNKILTVITAVTFAAALTLNIQASLNDPFAGMSDEAVALTTTGVTSETTGGGNWKNCRHTGGSGIPYFARVCSICKVRFADFSTKGHCYKN